MERDELIKLIAEIDEARRVYNRAREKARQLVRVYSPMVANRFSGVAMEADDALNDFLQDLARDSGVTRDYMAGWGLPEDDAGVDHAIEEARRDIDDAADGHVDPKGRGL